MEIRMPNVSDGTMINLDESTNLTDLEDPKLIEHMAIRRKDFIDEIDKVLQIDLNKTHTESKILFSELFTLLVEQKRTLNAIHDDIYIELNKLNSDSVVKIKKLLSDMDNIIAMIAKCDRNLTILRRNFDSAFDHIKSL